MDPREAKTALKKQRRLGIWIAGGIVLLLALFTGKVQLFSQLFPTSSCDHPVPIYSIDSNGLLLWHGHSDPDDGADLWASGGKRTEIASGWGGFTDVFSGGGGVMYAINSAGELFWYRHKDPKRDSVGFANNGQAKRVGVGWSRFTQNFSGGAGIIYGINPQGQLFWYHHMDWTGGSGGFANGGTGKQIGIDIDWGRFTHVFSGGRGVMYAIDSQGKLFWYRHNDWTGGSEGFANNWNGKQIGIDIDWGRFTRVFSAGGGVIYAIDGSGNLHWYRHLDPTGGADRFAGRGKVIGTGWSASAFSDIKACPSP